jgi:hypothetical protein
MKQLEEYFEIQFLKSTLKTDLSGIVQPKDVFYRSFSSAQHCTWSCNFTLTDASVIIHFLWRKLNELAEEIDNGYQFRIHTLGEITAGLLARSASQKIRERSFKSFRQD